MTHLAFSDPVLSKVVSPPFHIIPILGDPLKIGCWTPKKYPPQVHLEGWSSPIGPLSRSTGVTHSKAGSGAPVGVFSKFERVPNQMSIYWDFQQTDLLNDLRDFQQTLAFIIWVFPKIRVPENGWFTMETPIEMDDLGGTPIFGNTHILFSEFEHLHNIFTQTICSMKGRCFSCEFKGTPSQEIRPCFKGLSVTIIGRVPLNSHDFCWDSANSPKIQRNPGWLRKNLSRNKKKHSL